MVWFCPLVSHWFLPWDRKSRIVRGFPSSFQDWKSRYFFISGTGWETLSDDFWGEVPRLPWKWEVLALGAYFHYFLLFFFHIVNAHLMMFSFWFFTTLNHPDLEDRHCHRVHAALVYAHEIEDFNDLVDPRHLFDCCLGPEPSKYILEKSCREEKSKIVYPLTSSLLASSVLYLTTCLKIAPPPPPSIFFTQQKWPPDIAKRSMPASRIWKMNPCPI